MKNLLVLCFLLILGTTACRKNTMDESVNIANINLSSEISTLDPANSYDTISGTVVYQAYEALYQYHYLKRPYVLEPLLAKGLPSISDDGKTYTIKIKKGIKYHPCECFEGERTLKSKDFVTQIKRLAFKKTNSNGWWLFDGKIVGLNEFRENVGNDLDKFFSTNVSGLQTPDDHTLVIKLIEPYPQLKYALAMSFTVPMPREVVLQYKNVLNDKIVGTGPFKLKSWIPGLRLEMERFKGYHNMYYPTQGDRYANANKLLEDSGKRLPFLDGVRFQVMKEAQTRWLNFLKKKIDLLIIPKDQFSVAINDRGDISDKLKKDGIKLQIAPTLTFWWLSFNMKDPILGKNKNLRYAMAHAINTDDYIGLFTNNVGLRANSIYPPGIPGYSPSNRLTHSYDLDKAKEYLVKAGHPKGEGLPTFVFDVRSNDTVSRQRAEWVKKELAKIGINVKISLNSFPDFLKKAKQGSLQFWLDGWALDYPDSENILQLLYSKNHAPGPNTTYYDSKPFDEQFTKLKFLQDGENKFELMSKLETQVLEDLPWVMLYFDRRYILHHKHFKNYRRSDIAYNFLKYIKLVNK